jgi:lipoprotein-releasing system ATP-binding protein
MIVAKGLTKSFNTLQVLKGVDLTVNTGEVISIVGSSGAGKTTLLTLLGTLDRQQGGELIINGQNVTAMNEKQLSAFRNKHIGFIFQFHQLLPEFTALENVCIPAYIAGAGKKESEMRAEQLLNKLNLSHRLHHKPAELSGGEQQRVAVARALMNDAPLILADEPSGNLDSKNAEELHQLFFDLRNEMGKTFVIVTHNQTLAAMADRMLVMRDGLIVEEKLRG